jgi:hypothetical protein
MTTLLYEHDVGSVMDFDNLVRLEEDLERTVKDAAALERVELSPAMKALSRGDDLTAQLAEVGVNIELLCRIADLLYCIQYNTPKFPQPKTAEDTISRHVIALLEQLGMRHEEMN